MTLIDAGPLIALLDANDQHHALCAAIVKKLANQLLLTTWLCFTEAIYFLGEEGGYHLQERLWKLRRSGVFQTAPLWRFSADVVGDSEQATVTTRYNARGDKAVMAAKRYSSLMGLLICMSAPVCHAGGRHHIGAKKPAHLQKLSGYEARTEPVGADEAHTRLRIYNRKTGRVVWSHLFGYVGEVSWSADHNAAAILVTHDTPQHRILIWQAGRGLRIISRLPIVARLDQITYHRNLLDSESLMQATLSPDKQRVLIRASWTQGGGAADIGSLWCFSRKARHLRLLNQAAFGPAHWVSAEKIRFMPWYGDRATEEYITITSSL